MSGTSKGALKRWAFRDGIHKIMAQGGRERIEAGLAVLAQKAEEGDQKALEFFADRIDGKPAQAVELSGNVGVTVTMSNDESEL